MAKMTAQEQRLRAKQRKEQFPYASIADDRSYMRLYLEAGEKYGLRLRLALPPNLCGLEIHADGSVQLEQYIDLGDIRQFGIFIHALTGRYNHLVEKANETAAGIRMISLIPAGNGHPPDASASIDHLPLRTHARNVLLKHHICTIGKLLTYSRAELWRLESMGRSSLDDILTALSDLGLSLKDEGQAASNTR